MLHLRLSGGFEVLISLEVVKHLTALESNLVTHDLSLPMPFTTASQLAVLILGTSDIDMSGASRTKARIAQFAATTAHTKVIVLLLNEADAESTGYSGLKEFIRLQTMSVTFRMVDHEAMLTIETRLIEHHHSYPVLPIPNASALFPMLNTFIKKVQSLEDHDPPQPNLVDLIAQATASAPARPLAEHDVHVISDMFTSFQHLEESTRTTEGQEKLQDYFSQDVAQDLVDFWTKEWIV